MEITSKTRITNTMANAIATELTRARYESDQTVIRRRVAQLTQACYNRSFNRRDRALMLTLPDGWLNKSTHVSVSFATDYATLPFNGTLTSDSGKLKGPVPVLKPGLEVPAESRPFPHSNRTLKLDALDQLTDEFRSIQSAQECLNTRAIGTLRTAESTIRGFTTVAKLIEGWPAIAGTVRKLYAGLTHEPAALPARNISSLNRELGLACA